MGALSILLVLPALVATAGPGRAPHVDSAVRTAPASRESFSGATDNSFPPPQQQGEMVKTDKTDKSDPPETTHATGESAAVPSAAPDISVGAAQCPAAAAVERRLAALRAPGAAAVWYRVDVQHTADVLTVRAVTASGDAQLERTLPASGPCEELEQTAAVVLLAWEAQLAPGSVPVPQLERRVVAPAAQPEPTRGRLRFSAQGAAWLSSVAPVGGGGGSLEWRPTRLPLALALDVFGQGRRTLSVGEGTGTWSRLSFALGATGSFSLDERVSLTFGVGLGGGPFWIDGGGYETNQHLLDWDLGVTARALLYLPGLGPVQPFLGVNGVVWLRHHQAQVTGPNGGQRMLPGIEAAPCAGLAVTL